ncbi:MAG TPA: hypothetical protein VMG10_04595 [Gemmataceae bacterium]|nr:hypothetical protein [Gemmataceae bacterium]
MKRLSAPFGIALIVLLAAAASQARADYLNWTYTSTPSVVGVTVGAGSPSGGATVSLTNFNNAAGATSIPVIAYVTSTSVAAPGVSFNGSSSYNLALTITDGTTHDSGTLNFTGTITGSLSATSSSLVNTLTPVTTNSLTLDGHTYTVSIPNADLLSPNSPQTNIMATVSVSDASQGGNPSPQGGSTPPPVQSAPEPTSLVLGSLGFSCFGFGCWWKRRFALRRRPEQQAEGA